MTEILHSPPKLTTSSSSASGAAHTKQTFVNKGSRIRSTPLGLYRRSCTNNRQIVEKDVGGEEGDILAVLLTVLRKSLIGCRSISGENFGVEEQIMEIGWPTNVRHIAHVTFDRFNGFLGLPDELEPQVPRWPPSASTRVFGVSTDSMQLSYDTRGNCVPTILLMMQRSLYLERGLQCEGIFRINPENSQEEYARERLNHGMISQDIDVHCLAGLIKAWFRELPRGVLDSLPPEKVMQAKSESECTHLVSLLAPTEAALLDWAVNLMADVAQLEHLNKMNARNIAMVFAPNMTQLQDPLTALMHAVQVMNFLKTLVMKTMREREENCHDSISKPVNLHSCLESEQVEDTATEEPIPKSSTIQDVACPTENILPPEIEIGDTPSNSKGDLPKSNGGLK